MTLLQRLTAAVELLSTTQTANDLELRCFTPEQAAELLGKTKNWVTEAIQEGRVPHTYIGRSPRMTADHIRWVRAQNERTPNRYAKPLAA
jgi:excisionase family DNA binding protein